MNEQLKINAHVLGGPLNSSELNTEVNSKPLPEATGQTEDLLNRMKAVMIWLGLDKHSSK
ncbi:MAG: hypothetical protein M3R27_09580 [Bacteroidota bacterium]|nr:hypothetical protein [Bacteroidota bacterium]